MREPTQEELTTIRALFGRRDEAQAEMQACAAELLAAQHRLRLVCEIPVGAVLHPESGQWVRVMGQGQDGQQMTVPVIQPAE